MTITPDDLFRRLRSFENDLADIPQIRRGLCFCHSCGRTVRISAANFKTGWPKCCGYTMSLDSPEERERLAGK